MSHAARLTPTEYPEQQGAPRRGAHARRASASPSQGVPRSPLLCATDQAVLVWLSEQYAARTDQLALLLGRHERTARRVVARLRPAGLVEDRALPYREGTWVWLTPAGQRAAATGYKTWRPRPALLEHIAAVNDVRLHVARSSPRAVWVPERQIARELSRGAHLPDAVVHAGSERHAIEVERTPKARARTEAIVTELAARYDGVVYYCAPAARRQLDELAGSGRWPTLFIRGLPLRSDSGSGDDH